MEITSLDEIKNICRICLDCPEEGISIWEVYSFGEEHEPTLMADMLKDCASIKVNNLLLPCFAY